MAGIRCLSQLETGRSIREVVRKYVDGVGRENIMGGITADNSLEGRSLTEIASRKGKTVEDTAIELELSGTLAIPFNMRGTDIEAIIKKDYVATGSNGILPVYGFDRPHVRSYATFLYKIKEYTLKRKTVSPAHAVRFQTSLPAEIMNWPDRGPIAEGVSADIVVLELAGIEGPSSILNPLAWLACPPSPCQRGGRSREGRVDERVSRPRPGAMRGPIFPPAT